MKNKINKDKDFLIFSSVVFFMFLISVLWFVSIRDHFKTIKAQNIESSQVMNSDIEDIKNSFDEIANDINSQFKEIQSIVNTEKNKKEE